MTTAWRIFNDGRVGYVESINHGKGDRYSYTTNADHAAHLTLRQSLDFCRYMAECGTRGFHS